MGGGLSFPLTKETALSLGYRPRHLSNARTRAPNGGIGSHNVLIGISFFY
ncbi:MAG: acyloxyacyl hydrolase [Syntrophaceae bacterium]